HFPDHGILAEEGGSSKKSSGFQWIIDPLDGTTNYIKNIPVFTVSIAVQEDSQIIAGVVLNPIQKELFTALKGEGARLNEQPIKV
ncbi:MAG: inositol monophosphatase, partial [Aliifodinibius sp.]|nr:inositol monophosphatase [candidate division Zixibacteria bacterium]NIT62144.1 inositol monophosphatase [Fodinibius sp.]NIS49440.1 inositol monophosphatase [candidate division Zixibacteria bacterium]NIV09671.1 inositol monophosphatase [candidate division Zixibacteria bacterium]NIX59888.1 inositol monophosphatase [candidate division Zixibacteria bacterium]